MREILFRGKRKDNGEWIESSAINTQYDIRGDKHTYIGIFVTSERYPLMKTIEWYEVYPESVGEYTGLTENGTKIFEGDIVKCKHEWQTRGRTMDTAEVAFLEQKIRGAYGKYIDKSLGGVFGWRFHYFRNYAVEYYAPNGGLRVRNGSCFHSLTQTYITNRDLEVIGNIHDNPELLKGGVQE